MTGRPDSATPAAPAVGPDLPAAPERILVHRLGSLGDTTIVLPLFHMLRRRWPAAEIRVMTNFPVATEAAPLQAVLGNERFATGYFAYPGGTRSPSALLRLARSIRAWRPDIAIYANEVRSLPVTLRDGAFLRFCGARRVYGLPLSRRARRHGFDPATGLYEREAARIARALEALGGIRINDPEDRDIALTDAERGSVAAMLSDWPGRGRFMAFSPGTKLAMKDWTDPNWISVFEAVSKADPGLGIVVVGAPKDRERADALLAHWAGAALNRCGEAPPRISAGLIGRAVLFLGNDSGPMHLAASVGTPAVAVFSRHARPGIWFPLGREHRVFYPGLAWSGGDPPAMRDAGGETTIASIPAGQVTDACLRILRTR
ncbi:MAG: glycosyltransferase family 9 protein [Rhodospirillaceae bacterium]